MGYLWAIVQRHVDRWGVTSATLSRRMGSKPQTLSSWKHRSLKKLPAKWLLEALARETRTPYEEVLTAVLRDIGYLPAESEGRGDTVEGKVVIPETPQRQEASAKRPRAPRQ